MNDTNTTAPVNTSDAGTDTLVNEGQLLATEGHALEGATGNSETAGDGSETVEKSAEELFIDGLLKHQEATPADIVAAYPATVAGATMAAAEQKYRAKYKHLTFKLGSFVQDVDHPKFKNKVRGQVLCPSSLDKGVEIWVERATSDFFTFKGCPAHKKAVSKIEKAQKVLANAGQS